jgi:hypothetical protein
MRGEIGPGRASSSLSGSPEQLERVLLRVGAERGKELAAGTLGGFASRVLTLAFRTPPPVRFLQRSPVVLAGGRAVGSCRA